MITFLKDMLIRIRSVSDRIFRTKKARIAVCLLISIWIAYHLIPLPDDPFAGSYSVVVVDKDGKLLRAFLNDNDQWCLPPDYCEIIPQKLEKAVLNYEDRHFFRHLGVNPVSLTKAFFRNLTAGRIVRGGSTLTMQLARLIDPKKRSYWNKFVEVLQALKIEVRYSKSEILKMYLNHAPYGGNVVGYTAASLRYFGKLPERLTWAEAATLAVLPNSPKLFSPPFNIAALTEKRNRLLRILRDRSIISGEDYELSLLEAIPPASLPFEMYAPHLCRRLRDRSGREAGIIRSTIDIDIQRRTQSLVEQHAAYLAQKGINNVSVLVVETKTRKVRAHVGSQGFFDYKGRGQVDGVFAFRSTGSTLKPFLYALGIDEGIVIPNTLLKDVPSYYSSFSPENSNGGFDGFVTAEDALVRSLNVPAVRLLNYYGLHDFYLFLKSAGLNNLYYSAYDYGLPMIIGGVEASLWDMTALYCALGNLGEFAPLVVLEDDTSSPIVVKPLISKGASYMTLEILRNLKRPGAEYYWQSFQSRWPIAWKTGTSYGKRDAWAIGVTPQWTIAVWIGNFDGQGNDELTGARCAGPLLFDIFNNLPKETSLSWFKKPVKEMIQVEICAESGFRAGPDCHRKIVVEVPGDMKPLRLCPYHKVVFVTLDGSRQVCSLCWEQGKYKKNTMFFTPPDVAQYLRRRGMIVSRIPPHKLECSLSNTSNPLEIIYPVKGSNLWIPRDFGGDIQKLTLRIAHRDGGKKVYWYVDDEYLGITQDKHVIALSLDMGQHRLEVVDEDGFRKDVSFYVGRK